MKNLPIEGGVHGVGASQGYIGISILYTNLITEHGFVPNMTTHWELTREEIAMLVLGGKLEVSILGEPGTWPPIMLGVSTERIVVGQDNEAEDDAAFLTLLADDLEKLEATDELSRTKYAVERLRKIATKL